MHADVAAQRSYGPVHSGKPKITLQGPPIINENSPITTATKAAEATDPEARRFIESPPVPRDHPHGIDRPFHRCR